MEDNLLNKHGCKFRAKLDRKKCEGEIFVERDNVYLLQNLKNGASPDNEEAYMKRGYTHSWYVGRGSLAELEDNDVTDFEIIEEASVSSDPVLDSKMSNNRKKLLLFI